jgi:acyl CoA:acetate/3-ketoacid CoA transferase beta subunit
MTLVELAPGVTLDDIKARTEARFAVAPALH